jgi:hypothetical protein
MLKYRPLRRLRTMLNAALKTIEPLLFGFYAADTKGGRPGIALEKQLPAMLM